MQVLSLDMCLRTFLYPILHVEYLLSLPKLPIPLVCLFSFSFLYFLYFFLFIFSFLFFFLLFYIEFIIFFTHKIYSTANLNLQYGHVTTAYLFFFWGFFLGFFFGFFFVWCFFCWAIA